MKKTISLLMSAVILFTSLFSFAVSVSAATTISCGANLVANYSKDEKTLTISGTGAMNDYQVTSRPEWTKANLYTIEKVVIEEGVTTVGDWAFGNMFQIKSVSLPESLVSIGDRAFSSCIALQEITIPANVTSIGQYALLTANDSMSSKLQSINVDSANKNYCSVDGVLYDKYKTELIQIPSMTELTSLVLPNTVEKIDSYSGQQVKNIKEITIPESIRNIDGLAFDHCSSLEKVIILSKSQFFVAETFLNQTDAVICGYPGSYIETFANQSGITFEPLVYVIRFVDVSGELIKEIEAEAGSTLSPSEIPALPQCVDTGNGMHTAYKWSDDIAVVTQDATYKIVEVQENHSLTMIEANSPTCTDDGNNAYYICSQCGGIFEDSQGERPTTAEAQVIPAKGHSLEKVEYKAPTCSEPGNEEYYVCSSCGAVFADKDGNTPTTVEQVTIPTVSHNYVEKADEKYLKTPATCVNKAVYYESCSMCGEIGTETFEYGDVNPNNHAGETYLVGQKTATCEEEGYTGDVYCSDCDKMITAGKTIPMLSHTMTMVAANEATCTANGNYQYYKCSVCGKAFEDSQGKIPTTAEAQVIPAKGHSLEKVEYKAPTCSEQGNEEYYVCSSCGAVFADKDGNAPTTVEQVIIPTVSHNYVENADEKYLKTPATCVNKAVYYESCSMCGEIGTETFEYGDVNPNNHVGGAYVTGKKTATCTAKGYTGDVHCSSCDEMITAGKTTPKTSHTYVEKADDKYLKTPATCVNKAVYYESCSVCGEIGTGTFEYGNVNTANHVGGTYVTGKKTATCTAKGYTGDVHCSSCDKIITAGKDVPMVAHKLVKVAAKKATCKATGNYQYYKCSTCGKVFKDAAGKTPTTVAAQTIKKTAHTYKTYKSVTKATQSKDGKIVTTVKCSVCGAVKSTSTTKIPRAATVALQKTTFGYNWYYTGKEITPYITVKDSTGKKLKRGTDYSLTYDQNRKNIGRYAIKVTFKGNYSGTKTFTFDIVPRKTTITSVIGKKRGFTVWWKKNTVQTKGYQIQYSTAKNMKNAVTVAVTKNNNYGRSITGRMSKRTYYVRMRVYSKVKYNGKWIYVYSPWTTCKSVRTK